MGLVDIPRYAQPHVLGKIVHSCHAPSHQGKNVVGRNGCVQARDTAVSLCRQDIADDVDRRTEGSQEVPSWDRVVYEPLDQCLLIEEERYGTKTGGFPPILDKGGGTDERQRRNPWHKARECQYHALGRPHRPVDVDTSRIADIDAVQLKKHIGGEKHRLEQCDCEGNRERAHYQKLPLHYRLFRVSV